MSTQKITYPAGRIPFLFSDTDALIEEEQALPPIPDWPSIWKTNDTSNDELLKK